MPWPSSPCITPPQSSVTHSLVAVYVTESDSRHEAYDLHAVLPDQLSVGVYPTLVLLDATGRIVAIQNGWGGRVRPEISRQLGKDVPWD